MRILCHTLECLVIVLFQTAVVPLVPFSEYLYDPAIPYLLYVSFFRSKRSAVGISFVLGMLADGISGAPFGLYTTCYLWMTVALRQLTVFMRVDQVWMIPLFAGLGVLFEGGVLLGMSAAINPGFKIPMAAAEVIGVQALLAFLSAPFLLTFFRRCLCVWDPPADGTGTETRKNRWGTISRA